MNPRTFIVLAALALASASSADAQVALPRSVIASGGATATGGAFRVQGTLGQPLIGPAIGPDASGAFGFWHNLMPKQTSAVRDAHTATGAGAATIRVMPHPVVATSRVTIELPAAGVASLRLYDGLGRMRATLVDEEHLGERTEVILPADELESGSYTLVLFTNGRQLSTPVQITR